ncbi:MULTISPECIES: SHOCT domain-containing protein [Gordonia]|uniref:SHOCT domain-containing protein n=1 Tax=Gordonia tangerina TaxID=2911060 RepID=A0ABS9DQ48_9ACTN|nr:SHOCT domain-containing protein [Gordonia tangerina]MCF3941345.1 SHOCT domain-containing protein [Gordonia tangerina]
MMGSSGGMGFGMGWIWMILILAGFGVLVYLAFRLLRRDNRPPTDHTTGPAEVPPTGANSEKSAEKILEERYARGEIDTDEFNARLRVIRDR